MRKPQKTMIVVLGLPNKGKTATIRLAFNDLRDENTVVQAGKGRKEVKEGILRIGGRNVGFHSQGDVKKPLEAAVKGLIGGRNVGFHSQGDVKKPLETAVKGLIGKNCSIIVCAARARRTPGESVTYRAVKRCADDEDFRLVVIDKQADADHTRGNRQKANEVKAAVRKAIAASQQT